MLIYGAPIKQLDLFAGIGGISLAAEWAGIETVAFCEKEPFAQGVLRRRFPGRPIYDDVFNLTREVLENDGITGIDIVAGGFPCQPFSHAGKRGGTADDRYLWPEMCRIIGELRPTWVFAENVDGLVSMAQSDWELIMEDETTICEEAEMVVETIRKDLETLGYRSIPVVIPACGVGASHRRYRILILGFTSSPGLPQRGRTGVAEINEKKRARVEPELERSSEVMVDTEGERCGKKRHDICRSETWASRGGIVADPHKQHSYNGRPNSSEVFWEQPGETQLRGRQIVADSSGAGCQECDASAFAGQSGHNSRCCPSFGTNRAAQSGVGGSPYELSDWLDGWGMNPLDALINFIRTYPQPALMGQEQYSWEPPRVAVGVKKRVPRLKALGNAVDPLQALPVLYGIRIIHESQLKERWGSFDYGN